MFQIAPLPRTLTATLRDIVAKRVDVRKSALVDVVRHVDSAARTDAIGALRRLLNSEPNEELRSLAVLACADANAIELVPELLDSLSDRSNRVKQMSLLALGELIAVASDEHWDQVKVFAYSELPALRYQALGTLFRFRPETTLPQLILAADDPDSEIRWLAFRLLDDWCEHHEAQSAKAGSNLGGVDLRIKSFSSSQVEHLFARAKLEKPRNKAEASLLLLRLDPGLGYQLARTLFPKPQGVDDGQMEGIVRRLGEVHCPECIPLLRELARPRWFERRLRWPALVSLAQTGDEAAKAELTRETQSPNAFKRMRALEVVRALALEEHAKD